MRKKKVGPSISYPNLGFEPSYDALKNPDAGASLAGSARQKSALSDGGNIKHR
jgi:hypothetical protein